MAMDTSKEFKFNRLGFVEFIEGLGTELKNAYDTGVTNAAGIAANVVTLGKRHRVVVGRYSFAVQGGAVGSVNLLSNLADAGSAIVLPDNAIVKQVTIEVLTGMTSAGGAGTIALNSEGAGDLLAAVDADTLSGIVAGIPLGTVATMVKLTAARTLTAAIAVEDLTAGAFDVFVEYYEGN